MTEASKAKKCIERDYGTSGLRRVQTTTLFRAVNPELFIKPNGKGSAVLAPATILIDIYRVYPGLGMPTEKSKRLTVCRVIRPMMAFGLVTITLCVGYLGYLHAMGENNQQLYEAIDSEGERLMRKRTSKWT